MNFKSCNILIPGGMQNGEVKLTAGYPEFLSSEPYTGYTDAVLICSDRVRLKASVTAMAAASKMLNSIFRQGTCCDGDTATEINVESTSDCVVKVLHFVHTGCLYTTTPYKPDGLTNLLYTNTPYSL